MSSASHDHRNLPLSIIRDFGPIDHGIADTLYRSLVDCLPAEEVCTLLDLNMLQARYVRHIYLRKIVADMRAAILPCHEALIVEVSRRFPHYTYHQAQRAGDTLGAMYDVFQGDLKQSIVYLFLGSPYRGLRKYAYQKLYDNPNTLHEINSRGQWIGQGTGVHLENWQPSFVPTVEALWDKYKDSECAEVIIAQFAEEYLQRHFMELQSSVEWPKRRHLYERTFDVFEELIPMAIEYDPITAVWVLAKSGVRLDEESAYSIYRRVQHWEKSSLLLRSYGLMGLWRVIVRIRADLQNESV